MLRVAAFRAFAVLNCCMEVTFYKMLFAAIHYVLELFYSAKAMPGGTVPSGNIASLLYLLESSLLPWQNSVFIKND